jgi:PIN domain nuclease of toxin-antitoxin system
MKFVVIDTHILIWYLFMPQSLNDEVYVTKMEVTVAVGVRNLFRATNGIHSVLQNP